MTAPIETLLDQVEWTECEDTSQKGDEGMPYATHEGRLSLGGFNMTVYKLSNGQRVLDANDVQSLFGDMLAE